MGGMESARTTDCFGNATPGLPPGIADSHADIARYRSIPFAQRYEYLNARTDAMIGQGSAERAWGLYWNLQRDLYR